MSSVDILIDARIEEAIAKGIGPGARMIAKMLGDITDNNGAYSFNGSELFIQASKLSQLTSINWKHQKKVFSQDAYGAIQLFIPGDWEEGFRYLLRVAVQDHFTAAQKLSEKMDIQSALPGKTLTALWGL
jgi:hypothetical protein